MRDVISCFSENSVNVSSYSSCSSFSNNACISPSLIPSVPNLVSCVYRITLSSQKELLITIIWAKNHYNQGLSINFNGDDDPTRAIFRLNTNSRFFGKKKSSKILESGDSKIELFWDLSNAKYDSSPEPLDGYYYLLILVDSEIALVLGDMAEEIVAKKFKARTPMAKSLLISRREHCSGNTLYTTRTQFCETGDSHEIFIRCSGENEGLKNVKGPVLTVCIDKKTVIKVKRLQWNFRGNQTIFIDGLLVDLLWDVHDWFFNSSLPSSSSSSSSGRAVFMFRTRSALDSRLCMEEKNVQKEKNRADFSLLIYACKTPT